MFKSAVRIAAGPSATRTLPRPHAARRFITTAPPHQTSRSWRNSAARWGLAGALVYYYNTSSVFAEEPAYAVHAPPETSREQEILPTVESVSEQRRARTKAEPVPRSSQDQSTAVTTSAAEGEATVSGYPEALEEEAEQQGAFNEETGEINWDCPCLGGMAYGPCGEQFRAAFSCFVFSKEEPKGVDCIENFKAMQNCFREHPDVYGSELEDDEEAEIEGQGDAATAAARKPADEGPAKSAESRAGRGVLDETKQHQAVDSTPPAPAAPAQPPPPPAQQELAQRLSSEDSEESLVPKQWHDSR